MTTGPFLQMALNNAWSNSTLFQALSQMDEAAYQAEYKSFFGSIPRTLNHIHEVDLYYVDALTEGGLGRGVYERNDIEDLAELGPAQAESDMKLASFCMKLTPEDLQRSVSTERKEKTTNEKIGPMLLHLFQHQIHHRGQVHAMMSQAGVAPPQLDDFFLEWGRAPSAEAYWS